jgi:hypothetical protein
MIFAAKLNWGLKKNHVSKLKIIHGTVSGFGVGSIPKNPILLVRWALIFSPKT